MIPNHSAPALPCRWRVVVLLAGMLGFVLFPGAAVGQKAPPRAPKEHPTITARTIFDKLPRGKPLPVLIEVQNGTADEWSGLRVLIPGARDSAEHALELSLAPRTSKRFSFVLDDTESGHREVILQYQGNEIDKTAVRLSRIYSGSFFSILVVAPGDEQSGIGNIVDAFKPKNRSNYSSDEVVYEYLDAESLPDRAGVFDCCNLIVLKNPTLDKCTPRQLEALTDWLYRGGRLIVCPDINFQMFNQNPFYKKILHARCTGLEKLPSPAVFESRFGGQMTAQAFEILQLTPGPGTESVLNTEGHDLILCRPYGQGAVAFMTWFPFSPPFSGWPNTGVVFKQVADLLTRRGDPDVFQSATFNLEDLFGGFRAEDLPSVILPMAYLLIYFVILLPINYYWLWSRSQEKLAWVTIPGIVLVFTFFGEVGGCVIKSEEGGMHELHFVHHPAPGVAYGRSGIQLFSPAKREYTLRSTYANDDLQYFDPNAGSHYYGRTQRPAGKMRVDLGERPKIEGIFLSNWDKVQFRGNYSVHLPEPDWTKVADPLAPPTDPLGGKFTWSGAEPLRAVILIRRESGPRGDVMRVFEMPTDVKPKQELAGSDFRRVTQAELPEERIFTSGAPSYNREQRRAIKTLYNQTLVRLRHSNRNLLIGVVFMSGSGRYQVSPRPGKLTSTEIHVFSLDS